MSAYDSIIKGLSSGLLTNILLFMLLWNVTRGLQALTGDVRSIERVTSKVGDERRRAP